MPITPALLILRLNWARSFLGKRVRRVLTLASPVSPSRNLHLEYMYWYCAAKPDH